MTDPRTRAAQMAAEDEIFKTIGFAALKARARGLEPGDVARTGSFELAVAEDEEGVGKVVQMILGKERIESLAAAKAEELGLHLDGLGESERREWMSLFIKDLKENLEKWYQIRMRPGPGENFTFEKAVYRKDDSWR
ncbi:MAG: hypothetical protein QUS09_02670 [Methanotrichaceae archaeon]|nr:hypothetical protein [Methanotrichaceae archaeon]